VDLGGEAGVIEKSGAYYSFNGDRIAQGRDSEAALDDDADH
jgi:recombination protein RecA